MPSAWTKRIVSSRSSSTLDSLATSYNMTSFQDLSAELVELISIQLDRNTFCSFRLTCREVQERTGKEFQRRVCEQAWMLAPHSLNVLRDVCNDPKMLMKLQHLRIGTQVIGDSMHIDDLTEGITEAEDNDDDARLLATRRLHKYMGYLEEQSFFHQGDDVVMLAMIIDKLPLLKYVEVGDWYSNDQFPHYYYGLATAKRELGRDFYVPAGCSDVSHQENRLMEDGITHAFSAIISALAITKKPIQRLRAGHWNEGNEYGENGDWLQAIEIGQLPVLTLHRIHGLRASFSTLRSMNLAISLLDIYDREEKRHQENWLHQFVNTAENLQHLTITGDGWCRWDYGKYGSYQEMPASYKGMIKFFKGVSLKHLTHFTLQNAPIDPVSFHEDFMRNHKWTLMHLELRKVALHVIGWAQYLREYHQELMQSCWSYKVSWLEQWHTAAEQHKLKDKCSVVVFDGEGLESCNNCRSQLDVSNNVFEPRDCRHTSKTFTSREIEDLQMNTRGCVELKKVWRKDRYYAAD